ncbi:MAG: hypothetical protein ACP5UI_01835 [Thermoprotei archaeon]
MGLYVSSGLGLRGGDVEKLQAPTQGFDFTLNVWGQGPTDYICKRRLLPEADLYFS